MANLHDIVQWCNQTLKANEFKDYAPNGLQIEGKAEVLPKKQMRCSFIMVIFGKVKLTQSQVCVETVLRNSFKITFL